MMNKSVRQTIVALAITFAFLAITERASACQYLYSATVPFCAGYAKTDVVFIGKVINSQPHIEKLGESDEDNIKYDRLTFAVEKGFKGEISETVELLNLAEPRTSCSDIVDIKIGETWVILADFNDDNAGLEVKKGSFKYSSKLNKEALKEADEKLAYLNQAAAGETATTVYGQVLVAGDINERIEIEGLRVILEGVGQKLETQTDKNGSFQFILAFEGEYKVWIYFPYKPEIENNKAISGKLTDSLFDTQLKQYIYEYKITAKNKECVYQGIGIRYIHSERNHFKQG